jgi:hypothetical protein
MDVICESAFGYNLNALSGSPESVATFTSLKFVITKIMFIFLPFSEKTSFYTTYMGHLAKIYKTVDNVLAKDNQKVLHWVLLLQNILQYCQVSLVLDLMRNKEFPPDELRSEILGFFAAGIISKK